jgi:hypothetical protein
MELISLGWQSIKEKESSDFKLPDPTFGQDVYSNYISHDHLKMPVYMHLYKAVCGITTVYSDRANCHKLNNISLRQASLYAQYEYMHNMNISINYLATLDLGQAS